jgi:hypothetical protein
MPDRYVNPAVGSSGAGTDWASAYKTLLEATAVAVAGEKIYMANGTADTYATGTTFTVAVGVEIISTSDTTNSPPTTYAAGAAVLTSSGGSDAIFVGGGLVYGLVISAGPTSTNANIVLCNADNDSLIFQDCTFNCRSSSTSAIQFGNGSAQTNSSTITRNCTFTFTAAGSTIALQGKWVSEDDVFAPTGTVPTTLIGNNYRSATDLRMLSPDLSSINTTILAGNMVSAQVVHLVSPKLHASVTLLGTTVSAGSSEIYVYGGHHENSGLQGTMFYHENYLGSTTVSASIYCNDGPTYDGTNRVSWVVDGKAESSFAEPYVSPWLSWYNSDTSTSITPYFEVVRDGSASAYTNAEVWGEWVARVTANSPLMTMYSDKKAPLATAANQTNSSKSGTDWTGEGGTAWFGKLESPSSFTPAEVGALMARVCVAGNFTVHVDPKVRV